MNALTLTSKDLRVFVRDRGAVFMLFLLPFAFIVVLSLAGQGIKLEQGGPEGLPLTVVNGDEQGQAARDFVAALNDFGKVEVVLEGDQAKAELLLNSAQLRYALFIPSEFSARLAAGSQVTVRLMLHPLANEADTLTVERAVVRTAREFLLMDYLNEGLEQMAAMQAADPSSATTFSAARIRQQVELQQARAREQPLVSVLETVPAALQEEKEVNLPAYGQIVVVGMAVLFIFLAAQTTALSIHKEKRQGSFRRLLAAPITRAALLGGKLLQSFLLVLLQVAVILLSGGFVIQLLGLQPLDLSSDPVGLVVVSLAAALCSTSLGIFIAAVARTENQVGGFATAGLFLAGFLSGSFVPLFLFPQGLDQLARVVPQYWANQAFYGLIFRGQTLADVWPNVVALLAFALAFFAIGLWRFKFE